MFQDWLDDAMEYINVVIIAWGLEVVGLECLIYKVQRNVEFRPFGLHFPIVLIAPLIPSRVESAPVVPVNRDKENFLVLLHNMLCAITMMDVPVQDGYSLFLPLFEDIISANRNIVVDAEAVDCALSS